VIQAQCFEPVHAIDVSIGFGASGEFTANAYLGRGGGEDGRQERSTAQISSMSSSSSVWVVLLAVDMTLFLMKFLVKKRAIDAEIGCIGTWLDS
jgi:hypothetical protein